MRIFLGTLLAAALFAATPAAADMATAQQAYASGDFPRALELWQVEAAAGNPDAAWYVGNMYVDGIGLDEPDPFVAAEFYQIAVDARHIEAMASLGMLYLQGMGVDQDYNRAAELMFAAAVEGHPVAQVELANLFLYGVPERVERSTGHAYEWYSLAAGRGVVIAQFRLSQLYWEGIGVREDKEEGLMWIAAAFYLSQTEEEPYWSHRAFPLDGEILDDNGGTVTLRQAVSDLYGTYRFEVPSDVAAEADQRAREWVAERF